MALILVSRLLGFVRERAVVEVFGRSAETDAFKAAFNIPDLMYFLLVGGSMTAAFIPVFTEYLARGQERAGWRMASTFLNATAALLLTATVAGAAFAPRLAPLVAYGFTGSQQQLLVELMRWMFPAVFLTALAGLGIGVLNSYRTFTLPLLGPIVYNVAIILGAYVLGPVMGIRGMAVGTVAGAFLNAAIQWSLVAASPFRWQRALDLADPGVRRLLALMLPAMVALSVTQLSLVISTNLASTLPEGSITALTLANRVMQFPLGVFAMGMSTVLFPAMASQVALGQMEDFGEMVLRGLRGVLFFTIPSAVALGVLAKPVIRLLFEAGAFGTRDTEATAAALVGYSAALVSQSGVQILTRAFYSLHDTRTPVAISCAALVLNTAISLAFLRWTGLGPVGLALAFSVTSFVNWGLYLALLRRRAPSFSPAQLARFAGTVLAACLPMAAAAALVSGWAEGTWGTGPLAVRFAQVGVAAAAGAVVYGGASRLLGVQEARIAWSLGTQWASRLLGPQGWVRQFRRRLAGTGGTGL